jgi:hypothetical protein
MGLLIVVFVDSAIIVGGGIDMTLDHLVEHLTDPSTVRGMIWTLGAIVALSMIGRGETKAALEVLTQTALAVGAVGIMTRDHPKRSEPEALPPPDVDDGK